jgi:transcriptional regulator with XRE-family HTH domain
MCIFERLKEVLSERKINSIKEFAELTELPYRTAQSYLNGDREPNVAGLTKLCTRLGINLNWLLTGVGTRFVEEDRMFPPAEVMSSEKQELLDAFDGMTPEQRRAILEVGKGLAQTKPNKLAG